jgi:hypothetical protein
VFEGRECFGVVLGLFWGGLLFYSRAIGESPSFLGDRVIWEGVDLIHW